MSDLEKMLRQLVSEARSVEYYEFAGDMRASESAAADCEETIKQIVAQRVPAPVVPEGVREAAKGLTLFARVYTKRIANYEEVSKILAMTQTLEAWLAAAPTDTQPQGMDAPDEVDNTSTSTRPNVQNSGLYVQLPPAIGVMVSDAMTRDEWIRIWDMFGHIDCRWRIRMERKAPWHGAKGE